MKETEVFGYDISEISIAHAKEFLKNENLRYEACDIFQVFNKHQNADVFCMINSLFLLPRQDILLLNIHRVLNQDGWFMLIVPNMEGKNYKNFLSDQNNSSINTFVLHPSQFVDYFKDRNFRILKMKGIVYAHFYKRKDVKLFSVFSHFYLLFLNKVQSLLRINQPNYFLLVLIKNEKI